MASAEPLSSSSSCLDDEAMVVPTRTAFIANLAPMSSSSSVMKSNKAGGRTTCPILAESEVLATRRSLPPSRWYMAAQWERSDVIAQCSINVSGRLSSFSAFSTSKTDLGLGGPGCCSPAGRTRGRFADIWAAG